MVHQPSSLLSQFQTRSRASPACILILLSSLPARQNRSHVIKIGGPVSMISTSLLLTLAPSTALVGKITVVDRRPLGVSIRAGALPILCSLAESNDGQTLNVNVDVAAGELTKELELMKIVFSMRREGCSMVSRSVINLNEGYDQLMKESWVVPSLRRGFKELLDVLLRSSSIACTGTLIRRGYKHQTLERIGNNRLRQIICELDEGVRAGKESVADGLSALKSAKHGEWSIYADELLSAVAIVAHPKGETPSVFNGLKKDHRRLIWTALISPPTGPSPASAHHVASEETIDRSWHLERAEGSFTRSGRSLFCYGINDVSEVEKIVKGLEESGTVETTYLPLGPVKAQLGGARSTAGVGLGGTRGFATLAHRAGVPGRTRRYATHAPASTSTPSTEPKRVALVGARGYTGRALTSLLNTHPYMSLTHVSSRVLEGHPLEGYTNSPITHTNLSVEAVERMEKEGEADAREMALPNGCVSRSWMPLREGQRGRREKAVW
ncbi:hypothetical protein BU15DRAFT_81524 [Melanogaster broomeanus]|nr:hypothetical protein BU15DRAFT_81524 [Melanogaster broomeanus]